MAGDQSNLSEDHRARSVSPADNDQSNHRGVKRFRGNDKGNERAGKRGGGSDRFSNRVIISNLPYEVKWQDIKDYFRDKVGEVSYVEMYEENGKPTGRGIVEFRTTDMARRAVEELNKTDFKGRNLIIKEFAAGDLAQDIPRGGGGDRRSGGMDRMAGPGVDRGGNYGNTYGLSAQFLESLGITGPLTPQIFVANLDYKVTEKKLEEIFAMAGKVKNVKLKTDEEGKSKGQAVVELEHPIEAVQAISMFNSQPLFDRPMRVRMDKFSPRDEPNALPAGLKNVGMGLGEGGLPLLNIARLAASSVNSGVGGMGLMGSGVMMGGGMAMGMSSDVGMRGLGANLGGISGGLGVPNTHMGIGNTGRMDMMTGMGNTGGGIGGLAGLSSLGGSNMTSSLGGLGSVGGGGGYSSASRLGDLGSSNYGGTSDFGRSGNGVSNSNSLDSCIVNVRNLPPRYTWQSLRDKCQEIADVKFAEINRGIGAVRFSNPQDAQRAVYKLDGIILDGCRIEVYLG